MLETCLILACVVSAGGQLTWNVPSDVTEDFSRIIVSIKDADGNEVFHAFEVAVRKAVSVIDAK